MPSGEVAPGGITGPGPQQMPPGVNKEAMDALQQEEREFESQYQDWMKRYTDWKEQNKSLCLLTHNCHSPII